MSTPDTLKHRYFWLDLETTGLDPREAGIWAAGFPLGAAGFVGKRYRK